MTEDALLHLANNEVFWFIFVHYRRANITRLLNISIIDFYMY